MTFFGDNFKDFKLLIYLVFFLGYVGVFVFIKVDYLTELAHFITGKCDISSKFNKSFSYYLVFPTFMSSLTSDFCISLLSHRWFFASSELSRLELPSWSVNSLFTKSLANPN